MLKKIFNWKGTELSATEGSGKDVGRRAVQNTSHPSHQSQHPINVPRHDQHGSDRISRRPYHSETDIDPRAKVLGSNTAARKSLSGVNFIQGYTQVQEVASTVVCDFGEMDAASPAVQQVIHTEFCAEFRSTTYRFCRSHYHQHSNLTHRDSTDNEKMIHHPRHV
jgi:hypothetical protein